MLFATAYPGRPMKQTVEDCDALPLEVGARRKFMGANARPLLGI
jgi:predicted TIM-barrel fold metal-dependent hydrolase